MTHTANIVDIAPLLASGTQPKYIMRRTDNTVWAVRNSPVIGLQDNTNAWTLVRDGDIVQIPLIPYTVAQASLEMLVVSAMGVAQQLTESCTVDGLLTTDCRTHVLIGQPVERLADDRLRFWVGFAIQLH